MAYNLTQDTTVEVYMTRKIPQSPKQISKAFLIPVSGSTGGTHLKKISNAVAPRYTKLGNVTAISQDRLVKNS